MIIICSAEITKSPSGVKSAKPKSTGPSKLTKKPKDERGPKSAKPKPTGSSRLTKKPKDALGPKSAKPTGSSKLTKKPKEKGSKSEPSDGSGGGTDHKLFEMNLKDFLC